MKKYTHLTQSKDLLASIKGGGLPENFLHCDQSCRIDGLCRYDRFDPNGGMEDRPCARTLLNWYK